MCRQCRHCHPLLFCGIAPIFLGVKVKVVICVCQCHCHGFFSDKITSSVVVYQREQNPVFARQYFDGPILLQFGPFFRQVLACSGGQVKMVLPLGTSVLTPKCR